MSWKLNQRFKHLRMMWETGKGKKLSGTDPEFVEVVHRFIPFVPDYLQSDSRKFYIQGLGRARDDNGLFTKDSALYYQNVRAFRASLYSFLNVANGNLKLALSLLKEN